MSSEEAKTKVDGAESLSSDGLGAAVRAYHAALMDCDRCTAMLLSSGSDPEPARLMAVMEQARARMLALAGIRDIVLKVQNATLLS